MREVQDLFAEMVRAKAEIERLRAEVVTLAKLGDFEHVRPNTETYKLVARIRASGTYQQLRKEP